VTERETPFRFRWVPSRFPGCRRPWRLVLTRAWGLIFSLLVTTVAAAGSGPATRSPSVDESAVVGSETPVDGPAPGTKTTADRQAFDLSWWSVDGGGALSSGGSFTLTAAVGQPESGQSHGGTEVFDAGLYSAIIDLQILFADGFESGGLSNWDSVVGQ
jgi:hypothetical protein